MKTRKVLNIVILCAISSLSSIAQASLPPLPTILLQEAKPRVQRKAQIALEMNANIQFWVDEFTGPLRERFSMFLERGAIYQTRVQDILRKKGLPEELYYLAMIESGFVVDIRSRSSAVGVWQFMDFTARKYGLKVNSIIDERRDVIHSTYAACRYLRDLYDEFGSWYLAMAAYNAGEGRVRRAIRMGGSTDYWTLVDRGALPRETSWYIPQFQAAMRIAQDPELYGFQKKPLYEYPQLHRFKIRREKDLAEIAAKTQISYETIRALNPHLIRTEKLHRARGYQIWLPVLPVQAQNMSKKSSPS
jgi:membrane-bound lytic murein transglycosylase D